MEISVNIVNLNQKELLRKCLKSLEKNCKGMDYEVYVVDNGSDDGSQEMIKNEFKKVKLIENNENIGVSKARNKSLRLSAGNFILLMDNDVELLNDSLKLMLDTLKGDERAGAVTCQILNPDKTIRPSHNDRFPNYFDVFFDMLFFWSNIKSFFWKSKLFMKYLFPLLFRCYFKKHYIAWTGNMCLLIKREILEKIGLMDENFFIYGDDIDFCMRIKKAGYKILFLPSAQAIHHIGKVVLERKDLYPEIIKSKIYFFKKHYRKSIAKAVEKTIFYGIMLRKFILSFLFKVRRDERCQKRLKSYCTLIALAKSKAVVN